MSKEQETIDIGGRSAEQIAADERARAKRMELTPHQILMAEITKDPTTEKAQTFRAAMKSMKLRF